MEESGAGAPASGSAEELSPGAIAGIVLGVLAAVGAAGVFAVQQGWIQLPAIPGLPGPAPKRGSCAPQEFDKLVPGWPNFTGTVVNYCDGQWAVASANQTDWIVRFRYVGDRWTVVPTDGVTQRGMTQGCYNAIKLREQGAPEEFIRRSPICTPGEIGRR